MTTLNTVSQPEYSLTTGTDHDPNQPLLNRAQEELKTAIELYLTHVRDSHTVAQGDVEQTLYQLISIMFQAGRINSCERILGVPGPESQAFQRALENLGNGALEAEDNKIGWKISRLAKTRWDYLVRKFTPKEAADEPVAETL